MSDITAEMMKQIIGRYLTTKQPLQFKDYQDGWDQVTGRGLSNRS